LSTRWRRDQGLSFAILGSTLKKLSLLGNKQITPVGCRALSTVLQHRNCQLSNLNLQCTSINDEGANLFGSAISGTSPLKVLNLSSNQSISSAGWQTFLNQLAQTTVENLDISFNDIGSSALVSLANIGTLKSLRLKCLSRSSITPSGWQAFFNSMQTRRVQLKKLDISRNKVGNLGSTALVGLLRNMSTLKTLNIDSMSSDFAVLESPWEGSENITSQGWQVFFTTLQDSNLDLVHLDLCSNNIDDEGIALLVKLVSSMKSLKSLGLGGNRLVTPAGWQSLTEFMQSPNFALEELDLVGCHARNGN